MTEGNEWQTRWQQVADLPLEEQLTQLKQAEAELSAQLGEPEASQWQN